MEDLLLVLKECPYKPTCEGLQQDYDVIHSALVVTNAEWVVHQQVVELHKLIIPDVDRIAKAVIFHRRDVLRWCVQLYATGIPDGWYDIIVEAQASHPNDYIQHVCAFFKIQNDKEKSR